MKFEKNNRYFNIAVYTFLTWVAIVIVTCIILRFKEVWQVFWRSVGYIYTLLEPLIIGLVLAYLLAPLVKFYDKRCRAFSKGFHLKKRGASSKEQKRWQTHTVPTLFTFITLLAVIGLFVLMIQMNIAQVAGEFSLIGLRQSISSYITYFEAMVANVSYFTSGLGFSPERINVLERIYEVVNQFVLSLYEQFMASIASIGVHTMNWLLAFVVAFYLLQDSERLWAITQFLLRKIFKNHYTKLTRIFKQADAVCAGYIRGEVLDALIIVILTSVALTLIQLDFAIIIGFIAGIFNLIPYFGPIVGFVLAVIIGLLDPNPMKALYGAIAILVIQQIDGWFIVPKVVGDSVKLHPIIVLLVILIGGNLFGLIGMVLAVPVAGLIRVFLINYMPHIFGKISDGK